MAQVVLEHLTKVFAGPRGEGIRAVDCVSLTVEDKELLVLLGPSGCGKTTTLRLIAGLEEATTGTVSIDGRVVNGVAPENRDIAMVFQNHALYPHMTAFENMAFGLKLRKVPRAEIAARVGEAAEILGLAACLERKPAALSGGERQRVALGRAMVRRPRVFLFDEPLSNLDAALRQQMRAEIARLRRRLVATMIYVTHDQDEALTLGDRIAVMKQGVIQQVADPMNLYRNPANLFVAGFVGSPPMNFFKGAVVSMRGGLFFQEQTPNGAAPLKPITLRLADSSAGTLQAQVSGTDCFDLVYQSMQRPQYGSAPTSSVYYPFAFALFEVPLAWVYQCLYLAGMVLDPTTTAFSCPAYDDSYTLAETLGQAPFQQFDFTRVLAAPTSCGRSPSSTRRCRRPSRRSRASPSSCRAAGPWAWPPARWSRTARASRCGCPTRR